MWIRCLSAAALSLACVNVGAQQFTMKLSSPTANDVSTEWMKVMKAGIESRSAGRIKVEGYPANQLGQLPRAVEGVTLGTIELTISAIGFYVALEPRFEALEVPGLFDSLPHALKTLMDPEVKKRLASLGAARGIEPLWIAAQAPLAVVTHKPIRILADFKGQKLRIPGPTPIHIEPLRRLGASPIGMALGEALPAMQNKTIDGVIANVIVFSVFKYHDIAKTATILPGGFLVFAGMANRAWLKSLGPELEAIVREEAAKAEREINTAVMIPDYERYVKVWGENGGQILNLSPAEATRYAEEVQAVVAPIVAKQPAVKEDYDAISAVGKRLR